jgi:hypothetical protein
LEDFNCHPGNELSIGSTVRCQCLHNCMDFDLECLDGGNMKILPPDHGISCREFQLSLRRYLNIINFTYCSAHQDPFSHQLVNSTLNFANKDNVTVKCDSGKIHHLKCQQNGTFSSEFPSCNTLPNKQGTYIVPSQWQI